MYNSTSQNCNYCVRHFQERLDTEADRFWDEGILNQEKLD